MRWRVRLLLFATDRNWACQSESSAPPAAMWDGVAVGGESLILYEVGLTRPPYVVVQDVVLAPLKSLSLYDYHL